MSQKRKEITINGIKFLEPINNENPGMRFRSHHIIRKAIKEGIVLMQNCEICDSGKYINAHHEDYLKPLEVRWLCKKHHIFIHNNFPKDYLLKNNDGPYYKINFTQILKNAGLKKIELIKELISAGIYSDRAASYLMIRNYENGKVKNLHGGILDFLHKRFNLDVKQVITFEE